MEEQIPLFRTSAPESASTRAVAISPSLMCADMGRLEDEVRILEGIGVEMIHFDIMDGRFVPNLPLGLGVLKDLRPRTKIPFDVHLMVQDNDFFIGLVAPMGVERIAVHAESAVHLDRTLASIQEKGIKAGVALNPHTGLNVLGYVLDRLDFVLLMTVNPGFAGQKLVPSALRKIADCRLFLESHRRSGKRRISITVDGNVSFDNIPDMVAAGADILVGGTSSLYARGGSPPENGRRMREAIARGLERRKAEAKA